MPRGFLIVVILLWTAAAILASGAVAWSGVPAQIRWAACAALALETTFYVTLAWPALRARWRPAALILLAPAPYLIYSVPAGVFRPWALEALVAAVAVAALWFVFLPQNAWSRGLFLLLAVAVILFKGHSYVFARPHADLRLEVMGQLLWIRVALLALLDSTGVPDVRFGFVPNRGEWKSGVDMFLRSLAPVLAFGIGIGFVRPVWPEAPWWQTAGIACATFLGILWVVALSEEFFFRGLLQQWVDEWTGSKAAGLITASVLFGLVHLGFRAFPNWRMAALAALAGAFYGMAFRRGGGVRASMVTHALMVTTWKTFFR
jgi:membrane protease YdiL (CAAX protease family)